MTNRKCSGAVRWQGVVARCRRIRVHEAIFFNHGADHDNGNQSALVMRGALTCVPCTRQLLDWRNLQAIKHTICKAKTPVTRGGRFLRTEIIRDYLQKTLKPCG